MRRVITAGLAALAVLTATAAHSAGGTNGDGIRPDASMTVVEGKRETCWRTNRSTGQRFRIC